jgi:L-fuculose-phosphate aldolase
LRLASYASSHPTEAAIIDSTAGTTGESAASYSGGRGVASREDVVAAGARMLALGLSRGTSGNISVRVPGGMLVTPSGVPYDRTAPADLVVLDLDGNRLHGEGRPSSEWRLHAAVLRARPDAGAVVHAHPPFATALACVRRPIPPFHYMVALAGGADIPCAPYALPGTTALAAHAAAALHERDACLLANHGIVTVGRDLERALALAVDVEALAEQYCRAVQLGGPVLLTPEEMREAQAAMAAYRPRGDRPADPGA